MAVIIIAMIAIVFGLWLWHTRLLLKKQELALKELREELMARLTVSQELNAVALGVHKELVGESLDDLRKSILSVAMGVKGASEVLQKVTSFITKPVTDEVMDKVTEDLLGYAEGSKHSAVGMVQFALQVSLLSLLFSGQHKLVRKVKEVLGSDVVNDWELN